MHYTALLYKGQPPFLILLSMPQSVIFPHALNVPCPRCRHIARYAFCQTTSEKCLWPGEISPKTPNICINTVLVYHSYTILPIPTPHSYTNLRFWCIIPTPCFLRNFSWCIIPTPFFRFWCAFPTPFRLFGVLFLHHIFILHFEIRNNNFYFIDLNFLFC